MNTKTGKSAKMEFKMKFLFGLFYLAMFCPLVTGQITKSRITICINPGISNFQGNEKLGNFRSIPSFFSGLTYGHYCSPKILLQTGAFFEQKGAKTQADLFDAAGNYFQSINIVFSRNYLTVPVECLFVSQSKIKFYFGAGVYLSYLLKAKDKNSQSLHILTLAEKTKKLDFGVIVKTGAIIPIGQCLDLDIGIFDNAGLINTLREKTAAKNNIAAIQFGLSWKI